MSNRVLDYLASPYSHEDRAVKQQRFHDVTVATAEMMNKGHMVFSPITAFHPVSIIADTPTDWAYWEGLCTTYLSVSKALYVLMIDGWRESVGVTHEIRIAEEMGIPVYYLEWLTYPKGKKVLRTHKEPVD